MNNLTPILVVLAIIFDIAVLVCATYCVCNSHPVFAGVLIIMIMGCRITVRGGNESK